MLCTANALANWLSHSYQIILAVRWFVTRARAFAFSYTHCADWLAVFILRHKRYTPDSDSICVWAAKYSRWMCALSVSLDSQNIAILDIFIYDSKSNVCESAHTTSPQQVAILNTTAHRSISFNKNTTWLSIYILTPDDKSFCLFVRHSRVLEFTPQYIVNSFSCQNTYSFI